MCQQIVQFCSGSTKPLLFAGSFLLLMSAIAIGYTACATNLLYQEIDPTVAQEKSIIYYVQMIAANYLALITILSSLAAYYDQKHSIRALTVVTSLNFVLAVAAILMAPTGPAVGKLFEDRLVDAQKLYDFKSPLPPPPAPTEPLIQISRINGTISPMPQSRLARETNETAPGGAASAATTSVKQPLNETEATQIWDRLQARGCCGLMNATAEWLVSRQAIPKSCCSNDQVEEIQGKFRCKLIDVDHARPCIEVIGSTSLWLLIVLALIALINLYLATVTGISAYRTFHYNEASQNAYT